MLLLKKEALLMPSGCTARNRHSERRCKCLTGTDQEPRCRILDHSASFRRRSCERRRKSDRQCFPQCTSLPVDSPVSIQRSTHDCSEHTQQPDLYGMFILHKLDAQSAFDLHKALVFYESAHLLSNPMVLHLLLAHSQFSSQTAPTGLPTHDVPEQMVDTQSAPVVQGDPLGNPARHTICQQ